VFTNRRLLVTFFETRDEIDAAEEHFESMGERDSRTDPRQPHRRRYYEVLFENEM
jgi:hypothetical protein